MNLKKIKIFGIVFIFMISFLFHNIYKWFPNDFTLIFFPVNESIWEHMKMLSSMFIFYHCIEYLIIYKFIDNKHKLHIDIILAPIISIIIYLFLYLITKNFINHNLFTYLIIMLITIIIVETMSYFIIKNNLFIINNYVFYISFVLIYIIFGYLTYKPIKNELFFDSNENKYGINYYIIK